MDTKISDLKETHAQPNAEKTTVKKPVNKLLLQIGIPVIGVLAIAGLLFVPISKTNGLSGLLGLAGLNQAATGADLLANYGAGAAFGLSNLDVKKPESCTALWDAVKNSTLSQVSKASDTQSLKLSYATQKGEVLKADLSVKQSNKSGMRADVGAGATIKLQEIINTISQAGSEYYKADNNSSEQKKFEEDLTKVKEELGKNGWDDINAKANIALLIRTSKLEVAVNELILQIGKDLVEQRSKDKIEVSGEGLTFGLAENFNLGIYKDAKLSEVVGETLGQLSAVTVCKLIESVTFGAYKDKIESNPVAGRAVTVKLKSFSDTLDVLDSQLSKLVDVAVNDEKLLKFAYDLSILNTTTPEGAKKSTYDEFKKDIKSNIKPDQIKLSTDKELFEKAKKAITWDISVTNYVDRAFVTVGNTGTAKFSLTKQGLASAVETSGSKANDGQLNALCLVACGTLTLSGSNFALENNLADLPLGTTTPEGFWKTIESNQQFKDLVKKFEKIDLGFVSPGVSPEDDILFSDPSFFDSGVVDPFAGSELPCNGGAYEFDADFSVKCL